MGFLPHFVTSADIGSDDGCIERGGHGARGIDVRPFYVNRQAQSRQPPPQAHQAPRRQHQQNAEDRNQHGHSRSVLPSPFTSQNPPRHTPRTEESAVGSGAPKVSMRLSFEWKSVMAWDLIADCHKKDKGKG